MKGENAGECQKFLCVLSYEHLLHRGTVCQSSVMLHWIVGDRLYLIILEKGQMGSECEVSLNIGRHIKLCHNS